MKRIKDRLHRVMIIGATPSGIFAANKLGELGIPVTLVDAAPDLDQKLAADDYRLKSGMSLNHAHRPGLLRIMRNSSIKCILPATVNGVKHNKQGFQVSLTRHPTYVDPQLCTLCGNCMTSCPVELTTGKKAINANSRQGLPGRPVIDKRKSPVCSSTCPLGVNVQGYMALAADGKYEQALALIREKNILPGICGRVCTHPCESECRRNELEGPVSIRAIKRFLADYETSNPDLNGQLPVIPTNKSFAVIGSGPAGLTAAHELAKQGCQVTIFEKEKQAGGLLRYGIGSHRLPRPILERELDFIKMFGVTIKTSHPVKLPDDIKALRKQFDGVIITTGAWKDRRLGIPGENFDGVEGCISFLKGFYDGDVKKIGKHVAVIGDGNAALDLSRVLKRAGADVTIISWFPKQSIPADPEEVDHALKEGIQLVDATSVIEFMGSNQRFEKLACVKTRPGKPGQDGIAWPEPVPGSPVFYLSFDQAFVAIGQMGTLPQNDTKAFSVNTGGFIQVSEFETGLDGVYAAGDGATGPSTVVHAMAQGKGAAQRMLKEICNIATAPENQPSRPESLDYDPVPETAAVKIRAAMPEIDLAKKTLDFTEVASGLSEDQVIYEAGRCLQCGCCSECLECITHCPAGAVNHSEVEQTMLEQAGTVIIADPDMLPHAIKGDDIIRAYGPTTSSTDIGAMIVRGFASAASAMVLLKNTRQSHRGHGVTYPGHEPVFSTQDIKTGIFVCRCNGALGWLPDMDRFIEALNGTGNIIHAQTIESACVEDGISTIMKTVRKKSINRIVLASCVCCPLNFICNSCTDQRSRLKYSLFNATGINRAMVETCNIRGEALSLLSKDETLCLERFKGLILRSVRRAEKLKPFSMPQRNYNFTTAVIGQSEASMTSAMMLAETGSEVLLFGSFASPLKKAPEHPNIYAIMGSRVSKMSGTLGNFQISAEIGAETQIFHAGAVIFEEKALEKLRYIHQQGLPDRSIFYTMQDKDKIGLPFMLPGMTSISGLFISDPKEIPVSNRQKGAAAAVNASAIMPRVPRQSKGYTVSVDKTLCRGCGRCITMCTYQAITLNPNSTCGWTASVDESFCKGCGNCVSVCPTNAADSPYRNQAFLEKSLEEILGDKK